MRRAGGARGRPGPTPSRALPSGSRGRGDACHRRPALPGAATHLAGAGRGGEDTPHRAAARGDGPRRGSRSCAAALAAPWAGLRRSDSVRRMRRRAGSQATRASASEEKNASGTRTFGERSARSCGCRCCHGNWGTGSGDLRMRQASRVPPEARSLSSVTLQCGGAFPRGKELHKESKAPPRAAE